ncbi:MAG: acyl-ACP--UDP-N-acetylglucosamine O-acyltransferase [Phycisphaerales bacterium JB039]
MATIHPTAILTGDIDLADDVEIGPYCVLEGPVRIGAGTRLLAAVHMLGPVGLGAGCTLYPGACIGFRGQDVKFKPGDATAGVVIGDGCQLREHVTIHAATNAEKPTRLGNRAFMMATSHIAHDVTVGDDVTMVNGVAVGGHAQIGDRVILSGLSAVHQFTRIGRMVIVAGLSGMSLDVPPFCLADGFNALGGLNLIGLRRAGVDRADISALRDAYRIALRRRIPRAEALARLRELGSRSPLVGEMAEFVAASTRGICPGSPTRRQGQPRIDAE